MSFMPRILAMLALGALLALSIGTPALADNKAEIEELKRRIAALETESATEKESADKSLSLAGLADKVKLSGLIEVEAGYVNFDPDTGSSEDESDLTLATVELGIDADFTKHVSGHVLFLWEEDEEDDHIIVDEGYIRLDGEDVLPLYLQAGKMYVPFGNFDSMFISDPLTLELGETRESAAIIGYANDMIDLSIGAFNGDVDEAGKDNHIDSFVASAVYTMPEGAVEGLGLTGGISWISNIADSDALGDEIGDEISDKVAGLGAFVTATLNERWTLIAEYVGALDEFEAGELADDKLEPKTWNVELGCAVTDALEVALRYEGGDDLGDLLPDSQYGIAASYGLFEGTTLAVEYLHGEFENDDEQDVLTAQLAYEF